MQFAKLSTAFLFLFSGVVGCSTPLKSDLNESELARFGGNGTASVSGQAFLKTNGGEVRYAAGNEIKLVPDVPYTREIYEVEVVKGQVSSDKDAARKMGLLRKYERTERADGEGRFEFTNVPPGDYIVFSAIYWKVPNGYTLMDTGARVGSLVSVRSGEKKKSLSRDSVTSDGSGKNRSRESADLNLLGQL